MKSIKEKFQKLSRLDNKGLSLVELICSVAILSFIGAIVCGVMVVSADSYNRGNAEAKVQQEAQLVANQIDDLLIDATADVSFDGTTLKIVQGTKEYRVVYDGDKLTYQEFEAGTDTAISGAQLMASGVTKFSVDVADFEELGYIKLDMEFIRRSQNYPAVFTITARNKDTTAATEIMAAIYLPNEITLEPNQSYEFHPSTSGLTNTTLHWQVVGNSDSSTSVTGTTVKVGNNEIESTFQVRVYSEETGPTGAPKAQKFVNVHVRRVNGISITATLISGTDFMAGATYRLEAEALGSSLPQVLGADYDTDYVDPYQMTWQKVDGDVTITSTSDSRVVLVTLNSEVPLGGSITVKAIAQHPAGVNKTTIPYANVEQPWTHQRAGGSYMENNGGWLRQTNTAQATIKGEINNLKASVNGTVHRVKIRFREYPDGTFTPWLDNVYGDSDNSMAINLRPLLTGVLEYNKDYELQIKLIIEDNEGNQVWPIEGAPGTPGVTPEDQYLMSSVVERVGISFNSDPNMLNMTDSYKNDEASAPTISATRDNGFVLMEMNRVKGVDLNGTSMENAICYILEKKQPDGTWKDVTRDGNELQSGRVCRLTFRNNDYKGSYRVKVYAKDQPNPKLSADNKNIVDGNPPRIDYILYDEATGRGIYYFNVN